MNEQERAVPCQLDQGKLTYFKTCLTSLGLMVLIKYLPSCENKKNCPLLLLLSNSMKEKSVRHTLLR